MKRKENRLQELSSKLSEADQKSLLDFAEFLFSRTAPKFNELQNPLEMERPEDEKVVHAIKRLSRQYFMLDKMKIFPLTSQLMTEHVMKGRKAQEVINELEDLFKEHYELYKNEITIDNQEERNLDT